jgi:WD40 repeat protein
MVKKPWPVWDVAFSPDGRLLAAGRGHHQFVLGGDGEVAVWGVDDWKQQAAFRAPFTDMAQAIAFTADGKDLVVASDKYIRDAKGDPWDGNVAFIWTVSDGSLVGTLTLNDQFDEQHLINRGAGSVTSLGLSPDGELIGLARSGSIPVILHRKTGRPDYLAGHAGNSHGLAFSPNGKTLVSGTHMRPFIRLYDSANGKELASFDLEGGEPTYNGVRFSPDGKQIAVGISDGSVRVLTADLKKQLRSLEVSDAKERIVSIAYAAKADLLAAATPSGVRLFEASSGKKLRDWGKDDLKVSAISLAPDGKLLAAGYGGKHDAKGEIRDGFVKVWDTATGRLVKKLD